MKKTLILLMVVAFLLMIVGIAFAEPYPININNYRAGYQYNSPQMYTSANGFPTGPHGGYDTTTNKCRECHAVHRAEGSLSLTRVNVEDREDICDICHGDANASSGIDIVMGTEVSSDGHHLGDEYASSYAPDTLSGEAYMVDAEGFSCYDCHSIHANPRLMVDGINDPVLANNLSGGSWIGQPEREMMAGSASRLLLGHPNTNEGSGYCGASPDMSEWCANCHNGNYGNRNNTALLVWAQDTEAWVQAYAHDVETDGITFPGSLYSTCQMPGDPQAITTMEYPKVEPDGTNDGPKCRQCHSSTNDAGNNIYWPHKSSGFALLKDSVDLLSMDMDGLCLDCHSPLALP